MAVTRLPPCRVCSKKNAAKYRCPVDGLDYCSVPCFKKHKAEGCSSEKAYDPPPLPLLSRKEEVKEQATRPIKRLKDLKWPPEPDSALWNDPLSRDDIKPLRGFELEAVAVSPELRMILSRSPDLIGTLSKMNKLPRYEQEATLRAMLSLPPSAAPTHYRPSHSQQFSSGSPAPLPRASSSRGKNISRGHRGNRGRSAPSRQDYNEGKDVDHLSTEALAAPTAEEKRDVEAFVAEVSLILSQAREERGEMG